MALIHRKGNIVLTGEDGKGFLERMNQPDVEIMAKRDKFIDEAREKLDIVRTKGKVILRVK